MRFLSSLSLKPYLFVLVHAGTGTPYAARLSLRRLSRMVAITGVTFLVTSTGTLLFFRELELNRKLQDRLLEFETREQLASLPPAVPRIAPPTAPGTLAPPVRTVADSTTKVDLTNDAEGAEPTGLAPAGTRIADLSTECAPEECRVRFSLVPTAPGSAQGQLLVVLETEVPRIGAGNPTTQVRRRFYTYPGNESRDEISQTDFAGIPKKTFRFSRALQTTAQFRIAKLLRPLAVNLYLFGRDGTLQHHERKAIETNTEE